MLSERFRKHVELLDSNWLEILSRSANAALKLNGIGIADNCAKLESILNGKKVNYEICHPIPDDKNKKTYKCKGYKYNLEDDKVVGFALTYTNIDNEYIKKFLGLPDEELPIIGQVYSMYDWEQQGYSWKYSKLDLEISLDNEKLIAQTFYVGKKLTYFDDY